MAKLTSPKEQNRTIAVVFAADVASYSRLMAEDEKRTFLLLEKFRSHVVDPAIEAGGGRIANTAGDSVIAVFPNATDALRSAITIQKKMVAMNNRFPERKRLLFRIGLHLGEVYHESRELHGPMAFGDILGAGVNIAARLEASTVAGAVCVSSEFLQMVDLEKIPEQPHDLGELNLKNIALPVRAYEFLSARAVDGKIESQNKKEFEKQNQKLIRLLAAAGVIVAAVLFAVMVGFNSAKVAHMAESNRVTTGDKIMSSEEQGKSDIPNIFHD